MSFFPDFHNPESTSEGNGRSTEPLRPIIIVDSENVWPSKEISPFLSSFPKLSIQKCATLDKWLTSPAFSSNAVVILCFENDLLSVLPESVRLDLDLLRDNSSGVACVLFAARDGALALSTLLGLGVGGFLSADLPVEILVQALVLICGGSRFFNASCFTADQNGASRTRTLT